MQEVRQPVPATRSHPKRVDYEYRRAGVANVFMFAEPLAAWRQVSVRTKKTKVDWAIEMGVLLEGRYANCEKVIVVCDNLNTHSIGAFYEVFDPARARNLVSRIEFHKTPKRVIVTSCVLLKWRKVAYPAEPITFSRPEWAQGVRRESDYDNQPHDTSPGRVESPER